ncbi:LysR family transcriptional regulator [Nocardia otitidiscaviarum]|uniref:LysR family transcriptional regulator n=1 Tax=Nocardia otitidiscaviarum TaxID=1823 RepID=UPI0018937AC5|nr:LysR family transcriptional regulator [Nocardia otitidiscaviarum]MBF6183390.1 LysR family transcriptional regulator [Nocardia otitidiscaviarum]
MELRDIEILLTLAEELHFGRTAQRLHLSQARISQSIKRQERRIGAPLVDRSNPRKIVLTALGAQLVDDLGPAHSSLARAIESARRAARGESGVLRLGFLAGTTADDSLRRAVAEFGQRRPGWRVEMAAADFSDPTAGLAAGRVDVALLRVPFPGQRSFRVEVLRSEDRFLALPIAHRLAGRERIPFAELRREPFIALPAVTDAWRDHWLAIDARQEHSARISGVARSPEEFLMMIASGYGVALVPATAQTGYRYPGVVYRPVDGIGPTQVAVVCDQRTANPSVDDFVRACLAYRTHDHTPISLNEAGLSALP